MKKETFGTMAACGFGATIGAFCALEISSQLAYGKYFWFLGALVGGAVSYVVVDFRAFCVGVKHSYRKTIAWRPYQPYWSAVLALEAGGLAVLTSAALVFYLMSQSDWPLFVILSTFGWFFVIVVPLWMLGVPATDLTRFGWRSFCKRRKESPIYRWDPEITYEKYLAEKRTSGWYHFKNWNPPMLVFYVVSGAFVCLQFIWKKRKEIGQSAYRFGILMPKHFLWTLFKEVHSDKRTTCFLDASLGAALGYYWGSILVGTVAGAAFGLLSYELISVRWLKLVPAKTKAK